MSYDYNYKFWLATAKEINDIQLKEAAYLKLDIVTERILGHDIFAELYSRYVNLVNKLSYIYSRTYHVQKREIIEKLLQSAADRLIELRNELKNIEMSEFIYLDKTLIQKKLIPDDILLLNPPYFPFWRPWEIERILTGPRIIETTEELNEEQIEAKKKAARRPKLVTDDEVKLTPEQKQHLDSVNMIQRHERARTSRVYLTNINYQPEIYKPKAPVYSTYYEFSHKPEQVMLIPVKQTKFEANYYVPKKTGGDFQYYTKPVIKQKSVGGFDDELYREEEGSKITLTEFNVPQPYIEKQISERQPHNIEDWYVMESLNIHEHDDDDDDRKKIKRDSASELFRKRIIFQRNLAAKKIQRQWKNVYKVNKMKKKRDLFEKMLLGMTSERIIRKNPLKELLEISNERRLKVEKFREEFQKAIEDERNRIVRVKTPWIMEDISDHIRAWFKEFYDGSGEFHPFPDPDKGGTILVLTGETLDVREYLIEKGKPKLSKEDKKKLREKAKAEKRKEKEKIMKKKKAEAKIRAMNIARGGVYYDMKYLPENPNIKNIKDTMDYYNDEWRFVDEKNNIYEDPFMGWVKADLFAELHRELRGVVDDLMRIEYELLRQALAKDLKKKYKPPKPKKPKGNKGKGKGKGKKKVKDLTAGRSIPSLYYEMEDSGLIKPYTNRHMAEFIGDINYLAYEIRNYFELDSVPSMGEVRDIFREWILGMGPLDLKKPKSILIAGPCAKHKLCDIIASEINAVVIDLSPENVFRFQNDLPYLINLINKMARLLQPTIILISEVHRAFWKKVPKELKYFKPQLLGGFLFKQIVKPIKNEEKIFVLGTTSEPWTAKGKMAKAFEKILLIPKNDYASSFILWRTLCLRRFGVPRDFEFSPLALVTKNYTSGNIVNNIDNTIDIQRRLQFSRKPLQAKEFIETFLTATPPLFEPEDKEVQAYLKWFSKSNKLAKQRAKYMKKKLEATKKK